MLNHHIAVTGFMGAGKTIVGRTLAVQLGSLFVDLDDFITREIQRTPQQLIDEDGETCFREIETTYLRQALQSSAPQVIALGGGTWTIERNRRIISTHKCLTIWLDVMFEVCWQRIANDEHARPFARDKETARRLYEARRAVYQLAAVHVRVTNEATPESTACEIRRLISV